MTYESVFVYFHSSKGVCVSIGECASIHPPASLRVNVAIIKFKPTVILSTTYPMLYFFIIRLTLLASLPASRPWYSMYRGSFGSVTDLLMVVFNNSSRTVSYMPVCIRYNTDLTMFYPMSSCCHNC